MDYWDGQAATFDDEPDHGLRDPQVRATWRELLLDHLPSAPARIADLGCGTGTLSVLLAEEGYDVHGIDLSGRMVAAAHAKARTAGVAGTFTQGDAADPPLAEAAFDVVLARHVLWALPDPGTALRRWCELLAPGGRLLLVEGFWFTGGGLHAADVERLVRATGRGSDVLPLDDPAYWGRKVDDERYLLVSVPS